MGATTYDLTTKQGGTSAPAGLNVPGFSCFKTKFDLSAWATTKAVGGFDGSAADVLQLIDIPAGTYVLASWIEIVTPEGATSTIALGDASSAAGFMAASSLNDVAGTFHGPVGTDAYAATGGKFYEAADTLDGTLGTEADIDTAVFWLYVAAVYSK